MEGRGSATLMTSHTLAPQILANRAVLHVGGDGALAFLHNLLTVDLTSAKPAYGALLSPQGKILHDMFVVPNGNGVWVDADTEQAPELLKRLMMYRLRAKLDIALATDKVVAVGSQMGLHYVDPRLVEMGWRAIVDANSLSEGDGYDTLRILHGLGASHGDIGSGELFVHEANLDQLNAVSFTKGCYVGQEVVSRTQHRSTARKRILPVTLSGSVASGTDIVSGELRVGTMLSSENDQGLALIRLDRLADVTSPLLAGDARIGVRKPAWAKFELTIPAVAQ
jgi:tRNA-modifying protein YgfZ